MSNDSIALATRVGELALARAMRVVTAESLTGGGVAAALTRVAGSSAWVEGGFVTYRLSAKRRSLGVPEGVLTRYGAVSEPTARAMAEGALARSDADIAVAVTGIAGPDGGEPLAPVGTVWLAWARRGDPLVRTQRVEFDGDRDAVRAATVLAALAGLVELLQPDASP